MTDLLDARGYAITLCASSALPVKIQYLGAVITEHEELTYDEDPYVVSRVEEKTFTQQFSVVLKDTGIRKSGLKLSVEAEAGTEISVTACGEEIGRFIVESEPKADASGSESKNDTAGSELKADIMESGSKAEWIMEVKGLCLKEREYLARIHSILYQLLAEVDRICKKHGLHYFLVFGGLLGALRYGEIIPWDDDIDIAMTREDFERFKEIAPKELGTDFAFLDCSAIGKGAFLDFLCRILYQKEKVPVNVFRKVSGRCRKDIENHLALDIYILDRASDRPFAHKVHMLMMRGIYGLGMGHRTYLHQEEYARRDKMTRVSVRLLPVIGKIIPVKFIFWLHDRISTMYQRKETKDYFMSNGFLPFIHTRYSREWFASSSTLNLGNMEVSAPADVKAYLKRAYYDYYHYPPVDKRVPEHSPEADGVF